MFPENRRFMEVLRYGDRKLLAEKAGCTIVKIRDIVTGRRRMTDAVAKALIALAAEREKIERGLERIVKTQLPRPKPKAQSPKIKDQSSKTKD